MKIRESCPKQAMNQKACKYFERFEISLWRILFMFGCFNMNSSRGDPKFYSYFLLFKISTTYPNIMMISFPYTFLQFLWNFRTYSCNCLFNQFFHTGQKFDLDRKDINFEMATHQGMWRSQVRWPCQSLHPIFVPNATLKNYRIQIPSHTISPVCMTAALEICPISQQDGALPHWSIEVQ